ERAPLVGRKCPIEKAIQEAANAITHDVLSKHQRKVLENVAELFAKLFSGHAQASLDGVGTCPEHKSNLLRREPLAGSQVKSLALPVRQLLQGLKGQVHAFFIRDLIVRRSASSWLIGR